MRPHWLIPLALAAIPAAALAHVTAAPTTADSGARVQAAFRVGHGCETGAETSALRIEVPANVAEARPRALAGWKLALEKAPDGRTTAVTWRGRLPDAQFEIFELYFKAPDAAGPVVFPVVQTCGRKEAKWSPQINIGPAAAVDLHAGHH